MTREELAASFAAVIRAHWRDLTDSGGIVPDRLTDRLCDITAAYARATGTVAVKRADDAELTAWIRAHPEEFEAWIRKYNRVRGVVPGSGSRRPPGPVMTPPVSEQPPPPAPKPAARRTPARRKTGGD